MWKLQSIIIIKTLTIVICIQLINGKTPFDIFQIQTPSDAKIRNNIIEWIKTHPEIALIGFNNEEINLAVPKTHLHVFWKYGFIENGTDLLQRKIINNTFDYNKLTNTENIVSTIDDNGVRKLMERKTEHLHINFNERLSYQKIIRFLRYFSQTFPENVKLEILGKTKNNQYIYMVKLFPKEINYNKGVFLHAGVRGKEWISVLVVLYLIREIVENSHSHTGISQLTWYIIPVVNPDGYRYAYKHHKTNIIWQNKNRNCPQPCDYGECGVDIFRNFPWKFQGNGSSRQPCSQFYSGERPCSERESKALKQALTQYKKYLNMYIGIHGHENFIAYPWGYNNEPCEDQKELKQLAITAVNAIYVVSTNPSNYTIGNLGTVTYPSAGNPLDYAKHNLKIKYTYILHMRRPESQFKLNILSLVKETFTGIKAMATVVYIKHLPPKQTLRSIKQKRKLLEPTNIGNKIKTALFTWHFIITLVIIRRLYK